jgi:hypothetical protein
MNYEKRFEFLGQVGKAMGSNGSGTFLEKLVVRSAKSGCASDRDPSSPLASVK